MPLELIIGAAVGAAVASPEVRKAVRRGVVSGLAGILVAYDKVAHATHSAVTSAGEVVETGKDSAESAKSIRE
jgi:hypothetical protein